MGMRQHKSRRRRFLVECVFMLPQFLAIFPMKVRKGIQFLQCVRVCGCGGRLSSKEASMHPFPFVYCTTLQRLVSMCARNSASMESTTTTIIARTKETLNMPTSRCTYRVSPISCRSYIVISIIGHTMVSYLEQGVVLLVCRFKHKRQHTCFKYCMTYLRTATHRSSLITHQTTQNHF